MSKPMNRKVRFNVAYLVIAAFAILIIQDQWKQVMQITPIPYNEFQRLLEEEKIVDLMITDKFIQGKLKEPIE